MEEGENAIEENIIQGIHLRKKKILLIGDLYADSFLRVLNSWLCKKLFEVMAKIYPNA